MAPRGRKPGMPKIGGRVKGTPNKRSIGRARDEIASKEGSAVDLDPYVRLQTIAQFFEGQAAVERDKMRKGEKFDLKLMNDCLEKAGKMWRELTPYKHARLSSVKVEGTMGMDLSRLGAGDLAYMRKLVDKLGGD